MVLKKAISEPFIQRRVNKLCFFYIIIGLLKVNEDINKKLKIEIIEKYI